MTNKNLKTLLTVVMTLLTAVTTQAGKYQNFKVSTYIRAQDVARMEDEKFLKSIWETVSSQVDLDKIYLHFGADVYLNKSFSVTTFWNMRLY